LRPAIQSIRAIDCTKPTILAFHQLGHPDVEKKGGRWMEGDVEADPFQPLTYPLLQTSAANWQAYRLAPGGLDAIVRHQEAQLATGLMMTEWVGADYPWECHTHHSCQIIYSPCVDIPIYLWMTNITISRHHRESAPLENNR
jgi:hypothetical protein